MPLQDLTPQLRTRLSRMERAVGWFVLLAAVLLMVGFGYYIRDTAERKGWFIQKVHYQTSIESVAGLKVGDPVKLMGQDVGEITDIIPNAPGSYYNITVIFNIRAPKFGYIWSDSQAKVVAADFLGHRYLEVSKGENGVPTIDENTNKVAVGVLDHKRMKVLQETMLKTNKDVAVVLGQLNEMAKADKAAFYKPLTKESIYWLDPEESPALTERLEEVVTTVEKALPSFLSLTNQLAATLSNSAALTSNLNVFAMNAQPAASNLTYITAQLRGPGALGEWILGTNGQKKTGEVIEQANLTLAHADTNLVAVLESLQQALENVTGITSNLHAQVDANTNMLGSISKTVVDADDLVQGLKRHWLLRSAFKTPKTNAPAVTPQQRLSSPRDPGQ